MLGLLLQSSVVEVDGHVRVLGCPMKDLLSVSGFGDAEVLKVRLGNELDGVEVVEAVGHQRLHVLIGEVHLLYPLSYLVCFLLLFLQQFLLRLEPKIVVVVDVVVPVVMKMMKSGAVQAAV